MHKGQLDWIVQNSNQLYHFYLIMIGENFRKSRVMFLLTFTNYSIQHPYISDQDQHKEIISN